MTGDALGITRAVTRRDTGLALAALVVALVAPLPTGAQQSAGRTTRPNPGR